jgi:hypothetical protein
MPWAISLLKPAFIGCNTYLVSHLLVEQEQLVMCFLGFIRYNKTVIACEYRKYEHVFTQACKKIREASEVVEYDFYFTEYDLCPV